MSTRERLLFAFLMNKLKEKEYSDLEGRKETEIVVILGGKKDKHGKNGLVIQRHLE